MERDREEREAVEAERPVVPIPANPAASVVVDGRGLGETVYEDRLQRAIAPLIERDNLIEATLLKASDVLAEAVAAIEALSARVDELERVPEPPRGAMAENHTGRA